MSYFNLSINYFSDYLLSERKKISDLKLLLKETCHNEFFLIVDVFNFKVIFIFLNGTCFLT